MTRPYESTRKFKVIDDNGQDPAAKDAKAPFWVICEYRAQLMDGPFPDAGAAGVAAEQLRDFPLPLHNDDISQLPEGLYLQLFHGRSTADQELEDWGYDGPVIGPLKYCHTTYANHIKMAFVSAEDFDKYNQLGIFNKDAYKDFADMYVDLKEGLLCCRGKLYGDWSVFYHKPKA